MCVAYFHLQVFNMYYQISLYCFCFITVGLNKNVITSYREGCYSYTFFLSSMVCKFLNCGDDDVNDCHDEKEGYANPLPPT